MMQLMRMMNRLLDKAPETRRRHLSFHTPVIVPIWPQARGGTGLGRHGSVAACHTCTFSQTMLAVAQFHFAEECWNMEGVCAEGGRRGAQVRLVEEEPSYCTYGEAYEVNCARFGRETDLPIAHFKKRCCAPNGSLQTDPHCELRLQVRFLAPALV